MKKIILFVFSILLGNLLLAKTDAGIGVVIIDFDESTVLEFYSSPDNNAKPEKSLVFIDDHVHQVWKIKNYEGNKSWLQPEAYDPLNDLLAFRCIESKDGWMKIVVNNTNGSSYWLKSSEVNKLTDWSSFLQKIKFISRAKLNIPIFESPDENSGKISFKGIENFSIKTIKDNWIEVILPTKNAGKSEVSSQQTGWIKWKEGDNILIKYKVGI